MTEQSAQKFADELLIAASYLATNALASAMAKSRVEARDAAIAAEARGKAIEECAGLIEENKAQMWGFYAALVRDLLDEETS